MNHTMSLALHGERSIPWRDALPTGLTPREVVFGRDASGVGEVQVAIAEASVRPTKTLLDPAWKTRGMTVAMPVIVAAVHTDGVWLYDGRDAPLGPVPAGLAQRQLQAILEESDGIAAQKQIDVVKRSLQQGGAVGFANHFLFASYHLRVNVPKRADWVAKNEQAASLLSERGRDLINALGFSAEPVSRAAGSALVLRAGSGSRRAIAVLLDETEQFDQKSATYQLSPVAHGLELAGREEVPWLVVLRQSTLRLYPGRDGVGVGQRGQSETYFELDLAMIDPDMAGLLPLIFSAEALERGGSAEEILDGSGRYAAELGARLRDRVYLGVVPQIAVAIAERLPKLGHAIDAEGLKVAYALTLRVLFRLLFQAYAEDSELLPAGRNDWYDANSLQAFVEREKATDAADFSESATSIWRDLSQIWDAIFSGNKRWEVPAYGGSLFDPETEEGALLRRLELPDSVMGPALQEMLVETTEEGHGPVDFRSLQVREFGTIYEGLLESSLSVAEGDLTVDNVGTFVPAKENDAVLVPAGAPYFHSASGERKATGSYFTPKIIVDHLIDRSVAPALESHLARVRALIDAGRDRDAATLFWDFRVADLAMGSAHFLVAAVDKIERGMRDFLTVTPVPGVRAELARLADKAREALGDDVEAANAITEAQLLRRQVARRCVYGLDINPLAVELSRLALWIHTFVPGLPMSSLDHGLVLGNSLTGVGTIDEALDALDPKRIPEQSTFFDDVILDELARAKQRLAEIAAASEADKAEVTAGAKLLAEARAASETARRIFDAAVAVRIGELPPRVLLTEEDLREQLGEPVLREVSERLTPAHMPYLFPEVFVRDNPGFDVVLGNPPWEELVYEEIKFWTLRFPGLKGNKPAKQRELMQEYRESRPDLYVEMQLERDSSNALRRVLATGPYPGLGTGHADLYKAFSWRFLDLTRRGGRFAVVVPRTAISALGSGQWRAKVQEHGHFSSVATLLNTGGWVFPGIDGRYSIALVVAEMGQSGQTLISGPHTSESTFVDGVRPGGELAVDAASIGQWTKSAAFPQLPESDSFPVFLVMRSAPSIGSIRRDLVFRPVQGDFNQTTDSDLFDVGANSGEVPVLKGASFEIWNPGFGPAHGYAATDVVRQRILSRLPRQTRTSTSAYYGLNPDELIRSKAVPMERARIAFRDITNATNTRTVIPALVPPNVVLVNSAPFLVNVRGDARAEAYVLGVLSSIPFDWYARRYVELHLNFHIFNDLPVPVFRPDSPIVSRVIEASGRLAAIDGRYEVWARDVGVEVATAITEPLKSDLIAELDALVSLLYGLAEEQVVHVFATFHRGWNFQPRLDAVLEHYATWKEGA